MKHLRLWLLLSLLIFSLSSLTSMAQDDDLDLEDDFSFSDDDEGDDLDFDEGDEDLGSDDEFSDFDDIDEEDFDEKEDEEVSFDDFEEGPAEEVQEEAENLEDDNLELEPIDPSDEEVAEEPLPEPLPDETPEESYSLRASDEPDLAKEARYYDIYLNYHKDKMSEETWSNIVGERASEIYQILGGDSLWGISETLFGEGNYWPKVWSLNSRIANPHLITEGNNIRFLLGDESDAPTFTVTDMEEPEVEPPPEESLDIERAEYKGETSSEPELEIPPPLKRSKPVVKKLPPSLPFWSMGGANQFQEYDDSGISYGKRKILDLKDTAPLSYYIVERDPERIGRISEMEEGSRLASAFQYIYVSMSNGEGQVGDTYTVINNTGPLRAPNDAVAGELGYSVQVQGEIQLVERVDGTDTENNGELFRAIVTRVVNPISRGAYIVSDKIEMMEINNKGPKSQVVAQIIGGQFFDRRQVYGADSIAYINRGANDGLEEGQVLSIRSNRKIRNPDSVVEGNIRPIGWLKVVRTTPNFSTTVIVKAWSDILAGDVTGAGKMYARAGGGGDFGESDDGLMDEEEFNDEFDDDQDAGEDFGDEDEEEEEESEDFGNDELEFEDEDF